MWIFPQSFDSNKKYYNQIFFIFIINMVKIIAFNFIININRIIIIIKVILILISLLLLINIIFIFFSPHHNNRKIIK